MSWFITLYSIVNLLAAVISITIAFLVPQRTAQADWGFRLFAAMTAIWCATSALFFINRSLNDYWIWTGIQLIPIALIPVLWLYFILQFTGDRRPPPILLILVPFATLIVYWNPHWSSLMWKISAIDGSLGILIAQYERGIWFKFIHMPYSYALIMIGHAYLFRAILQSRKNQRQSLYILLICGLLPLFLNVLTLSPFYNPFRFFDLTPIGLSISSVLFCWGLSHFYLLQRSPLAYQQIFSSLKASILVVDLQDKIIEFNSSAADLLGCTPKTIGKSAKELISFLKYYDWAALVKNGETEVFAQQQFFHLERLPIIRKRRLLGYILNISDITQARKLQQQILQGALLYDALTGLPNRTLFSDRLEQAIRQLNRDDFASLAVAFIDIDRFKVINDSLGHLAGDQVLIWLTDKS